MVDWGYLAWLQYEGEGEGMGFANAVAGIQMTSAKISMRKYFMT